MRVSLRGPFYFACFLILLLAPTPLFGQEQSVYATRMLERMATMLSLSPNQLPTSYIQGDTTATLTTHNSLPSGMRLKVKRRDQTVIHIGFHFFEPADEQIVQPIGAFLERQLLYYHLMGNTDLSQTLEQHRVQLYYNKQRYGDIGFTSLEPVLQLVGNRSSYTIDHTNTTITVSFLQENGNQVEFQFPAHAWLIEGMEKDELDKNLLKLLRSPLSQPMPALSFQHLDIVPYKDDLGTYKVPPLSEGISGDLFFQKQQQQWALLSDPTYFTESLSNRLLKPDDTSIQLKVLYQGYGEDPPMIDVPYTQLAGHLYASYDPYVTFTQQTDDAVFVSVIWAHKSYLHLHMLSLTWPVNDYQLGDKVVLTGAFFPYIRRDNVKDLFSDE